MVHQTSAESSARHFWVILLAAMITSLTSSPGICGGKHIQTYHGHGVYDYYAPSTYPALLLRNVLAYHLKPAQEGLDSGNWAKAEGNLSFILNYFPNQPQGLKLALMYSEKSGHKQFTLERIRKALDINPNVAWTHVIYGVYLHRQKDLTGAEQEYRKAIKLDPRLADAYYNLGLALLDAGRPKEAKEAAQKAYARGYPLPGLRMRLEKAGVWSKTKVGKSTQ